MRILSFIGGLAILAGIAVGVFFLGGFFSVSAIGDDPPPVAALVMRVRQASIAHHAPGAPHPGFNPAGAVEAGAKAFAARGCATCHGGPGVGWAKFSEGLNPGPPDLKEVAPNLSLGEIYWVVKNGIRMTGMPSFGAIGASENELWAIASFVKQIPSVSDAQYKQWTAGP